MNMMVGALWEFRGFILGSVRRELQSRYRNSLLGAFWLVLPPLAQIVVYTLIFSQIMQARVPGVESSFGYSIYLCAGILTWGLFADIVGRSMNVFIENSNLLKKLSFPRICLPFIVIVSAGVNFLIIFGLFTAFLILAGAFPGWIYLAVVPLLVVQILFSVGVGVTLGVLNVFFRDVGQFFGVVLQFWFWLTPIVYPASILPERLQALMAFNPMAVLIDGYQRVLVNGHSPQWSQVGIVAILSLALCALALRLFRTRSGEMVDEL